MLLEAYRECLRDVFDMPAFIGTLRDVAQRNIRIVTVDSTVPSPFAAGLLFGYVANYLYEGDAPLAERRAQALSIDHAQLRTLLGDAELRDVLDRDAIDDVARDLQRLSPTLRVRSADSLHDLLLRLGDLAVEEIEARAQPGVARPALEALVLERRAVAVPVTGESRYIAVEDAARYRDALGCPLPLGLPDALLAPVRDPLRDLVMRYARTHPPFTADAVARRLGLAGTDRIATVLRQLVAAGRLHEGDFTPGETHREWCEPGVLALIRRRSLAKLRRQVEPVDPSVLGRLVTRWQGVTRRRRGLDALLDVIESLQGVPMAASVLESEILPARIEDYAPSDLDTLLAAGEVIWSGVEPLGDRDGRVALFLTDHMPRLWRGPSPAVQPGERERALLDYLEQQGASFFGPLHEAAGGGYPRDTVDALWNLVWAGSITNDSLQPLRAFVSGASEPTRRVRPAAGLAGRPFRSRRQVPKAAEGRWSALTSRISRVNPTEWSASLAQQLLSRYGLVTREVAGAEGIQGGFSAVYDALKALEEAGRIRRGYFVSGVGATQFALPPALDLLRSLRTLPEEPESLLLAASDPANPYGGLLKWPDASGGSSDPPADPAPTEPADSPRAREAAASARRTPTRAVGSRVVLVDDSWRPGSAAAAGSS